MREVKSITDGISKSDNSFAGFVDKGVLQRISDLENGELKEMYALYSESSHNTATSDSVSFYERTEKGDCR